MLWNVLNRFAVEKVLYSSRFDLPVSLWRFMIDWLTHSQPNMNLIVTSNHRHEKTASHIETIILWAFSHIAHNNLFSLCVCVCAISVAGWSNYPLLTLAPQRMSFDIFVFLDFKLLLEMQSWKMNATDGFFHASYSFLSPYSPLNSFTHTHLICIKRFENCYLSWK